MMKAEEPGIRMPPPIPGYYQPNRDGQHPPNPPPYSFPPNMMNNVPPYGKPAMPPNQGE